jgi:hypothetical protein
MQRLKIRFELAMFFVFLVSLILLWPLLMILDNGWLIHFKNNLLTALDDLCKRLEEDI